MLISGPDGDKRPFELINKDFKQIGFFVLF